jgi:hypothetical protein
MLSTCGPLNHLVSTLLGRPVADVGILCRQITCSSRLVLISSLFFEDLFEGLREMIRMLCKMIQMTIQRAVYTRAFCVFICVCFPVCDCAAKSDICQKRPQCRWPLKQLYLPKETLPQRVVGPCHKSQP